MGACFYVDDALAETGLYDVVNGGNKLGLTSLGMMPLAGNDADVYGLALGLVKKGSDCMNDVVLGLADSHTVKVYVMT